MDFSNIIFTCHVETGTSGDRCSQQPPPWHSGLLQRSPETISKCAISFLGLYTAELCIPALRSEEPGSQGSRSGPQLMGTGAGGLVFRVALFSAGPFWGGLYSLPWVYSEPSPSCPQWSHANGCTLPMSLLSPGHLPTPSPLSWGHSPINCFVVVIQSLSRVWLFRPSGLQHARPPWPSLSPRVCSDSRPLSWWCHPTISSSLLLLPLTAYTLHVQDTTEKKKKKTLRISRVQESVPCNQSESISLKRLPLNMFKYILPSLSF